MEFQGNLLYLGDQGYEFKNEQNQQVKMLKTRWMALGTIDIFDFNIMDETLAQKVANIKPQSVIECLFIMGARKDLKPYVRLLDVVVPNALKPK